MITFNQTCRECGRVFDMLDEDEAGEWYYGHDCPPEAIDISGKTRLTTGGRSTDNQDAAGRIAPAIE